MLEKRLAEPWRKKISLNILNIFRKGQRMSLLLTNPDQVQLK